MAADAWDIRPDETSSAFEKFRLYRDAGPKRTVRTSVEAYNEAPATKNQVRAFQRLAEKYEWKDRAMAWDAELDRQRLEAEKAEVERMRERHVQQSRSLQAVGAHAVKRILEKYENNQDPEISPSVAVQFMQQGINLERLARGEATAIEEQLRGRKVVRIEWPWDISEADYGDDSPDAETALGPGADPEE